MTDDSNVVTQLAPGGRLRAAINFGNTVLAQKDPAGGEPRGVSAELARELARRLGVAIDYVPYDAAGKVFDALKAGAWDIAFLGSDPVREKIMSFTAAYVELEATYLVPASSTLRNAAEVDRAGLRLRLLKQQAETGDITLLFGDESEALTHPYLARAWAKRGSDLRIEAPFPRDRNAPAFLEHRRQLLSELGVVSR